MCQLSDTVVSSQANQLIGVIDWWSLLLFLHYGKAKQQGRSTQPNKTIYPMHVRQDRQEEGDGVPHFPQFMTLTIWRCHCVTTCEDSTSFRVTQDPTYSRYIECRVDIRCQWLELIQTWRLRPKMWRVEKWYLLATW